ncbi:MAG: hypothetical protein PGN13_13940 [Patulibacter minatonensis]
MALPLPHQDVHMNVAPGVATRRVSYPGELGFPPTPVSFEIPVGWTTTPVRGALAVVRDDRPGPDGFHANLVVSVDRIGSGVTLSAAARGVHNDAIGVAHRFELIAERVLAIDETPAILREQVVEVTGGVTPLAQSVLLHVVDVGDGVARDCIQLTMTAEVAMADEARARMADLISTLVVGER